MARRHHGFNLPVRGKTHGSGMKRGRRGVNPKMHRVKNRGANR